MAGSPLKPLKFTQNNQTVSSDLNQSELKESISNIYGLEPEIITKNDNNKSEIIQVLSKMN